MTFLHLDDALALGVDGDFMPVPVHAAGIAAERGRLPRDGRFGRLEVVGRELVGVGERSHHKTITNRAHRRQQQGSHRP